MFENLPKHFIISFFGKPGSGKSFCIKYFLAQLYAQKKCDVVIVFTNTNNNGFYQEFVDPKYVMRYSDKTLTRVWEQARAIAHKKKSIVLVFDDILGSINFDSPIWNELTANHRHNNVSILIASQSMTKLPVYVRDYSNYAVIFYQTTRFARRNAHAAFGEDFGDINEFTAYIKLLSRQQFSFIFVDTTAAERSKKYKIMICPGNIPNFKITNIV